MIIPFEVFRSCWIKQCRQLTSERYCVWLQNHWRCLTGSIILQSGLSAGNTRELGNEASPQPCTLTLSGGMMARNSYGSPNWLSVLRHLKQQWRGKKPNSMTSLPVQRKQGILITLEMGSGGVPHLPGFAQLAYELAHNWVVQYTPILRWLWCRTMLSSHCTMHSCMYNKGKSSASNSEWGEWKHKKN